MTPLEKLNRAILIASDIGIDSTLEDLDIAEDEAMMIVHHADELEGKLLDDIYAAMEVRRHG